MRIGTWTVIELWRNKYNHKCGICVCDCGFKATRNIDLLIRNSKKYPTRCWHCFKKESSHSVVGKVFGTRLVIEDFFKHYAGRNYIHFAKCKCSCGDISEVLVKNLVNGIAKKCNKCRIKAHLKRGSFNPNVSAIETL